MRPGSAPRIDQGAGHDPHHDLRSAQERRRRARSRPRRTRASEVTRPTCPGQPRGATSTVTSTWSPARVAPLRQLLLVEDVGRSPGTDEDGDPSRTAPGRPAPGGRRVAAERSRCRRRRPARRTPRPRRPASPPRTGLGPRPSTPGREAAQRPGRGADGADRVAHLPARSRARAHRDRHLAGAERVEHRELAGPVVRRSARPRPPARG